MRIPEGPVTLSSPSPAERGGGGVERGGGEGERGGREGRGGESVAFEQKFSHLGMADMLTEPSLLCPASQSSYEWDHLLCCSANT